MHWLSSSSTGRRGGVLSGIGPAVAILVCVVGWRGGSGVAGSQLEQQCRRDGVLDEGCVAERLDSEEALQVASTLALHWLLCLDRVMSVDDQNLELRPEALRPDPDPSPQAAFDAQPVSYRVVPSFLESQHAPHRHDVALCTQGSVDRLDRLRLAAHHIISPPFTTATPHPPNMLLVFRVQFCIAAQSILNDECACALCADCRQSRGGARYLLLSTSARQVSSESWSCISQYGNCEGIPGRVRI